MREQLQQLMADIFGMLPQEITEDSSVETVESWDSLAHLRLIVALEEKFGIKIEENDVIGLNSFRSVLSFLGKNSQK